MERSEQLRKLQITLRKAGYIDDLAIAKLLLENDPSDRMFEEIISRSLKGEPWQYIVGKVQFHSVTLLVDQNVLIPRIETELMVDLVLDAIHEARERDSREIYYIDIGTGSGAIPIAVSHHLNDSNLLTDNDLRSEFLSNRKIHIHATDISDSALDLARKNADLNSLGKNINFLKSDLLSATDLQRILNEPGRNYPLELILSANLPYISEEEYEELDDSVRNWEPRNALIGGIKGDELIIELLEQLQTLNSVTRRSVTVILEADPEQIADISIKAVSYGYNAKVVRDQYGVDRFILLKKV